MRKRKAPLNLKNLIYQVETKVFNQAVKRNIDRFPENFRFQLTQDEFDTINLRSQFVTSSLNYGGRRYLSYDFTEQGIAMLRSYTAVKGCPRPFSHN